MNIRYPQCQQNGVTGRQNKFYIFATGLVAGTPEEDREAQAPTAGAQADRKCDCDCDRGSALPDALAVRFRTSFPPSLPPPVSASTLPRNEPHSFPQVNSRSVAVAVRLKTATTQQQPRRPTPVGALHRKKGRKKVHYLIKVSPLLRPICCPPARARPLLHRSRTEGRTDSAFLPPCRFPHASFPLHPFLPCVYAISFCTLLSVVWRSPEGGREDGAMESTQRARSGSEGGSR